MEKAEGRFLNRRWLDFRNGHSIYLVFIMNFINFILLVYNLAITQVPFARNIFENEIIFAAIFVAAYIPSAIVMGYLHRRRQLSTENEVMIRENWLHAWQYLCFLRIMRGTATKDEVDQVMKYFEDILKRHNKTFLIKGD
ncbi:MAG: hypothetical protein ABI361_03715 [Nitrososphaera sp.]